MQIPKYFLQGVAAAVLPAMAIGLAAGVLNYEMHRPPIERDREKIERVRAEAGLPASAAATQPATQPAAQPDRTISLPADPVYLERLAEIEAD